MAETTAIQWCDATFSPWRGCAKVSEGCKHCYAEHLVTKRQGLPVWGQDAERRVAAERTWKNLRRWNAQAEAASRPVSVFPSLCDIFEDYTGPNRLQVDAARLRYFRECEATPHLRHLLLTKRPENVRRMIPRHWLESQEEWHLGEFCPRYVPQWPRNVAIGCTIENQARADERLSHLVKLPAPMRFVSYEPALGPLVFGAWVSPRGEDHGRDSRSGDRWRAVRPGIDWIICGGESGPGARPFDLKWARDVRAQCLATGTAFFFKQAGAFPYDSTGQSCDAEKCCVHEFTRIALRDKKGGDLAEIPMDLRVRETPIWRT